MNIHDMAVGFGAIVGTLLLQWFAKYVDGTIVTNWITAEFQKLRNLEHSTKAGQIAAQFHADSALWTMAENMVPVVFGELSDDIKALIASGDFSKIDFRKIGASLWAKIRDQAQGGWHDYLANSSHDDGEKLCAMVAQAVLSKIHMTNVITAPAAVESTTTVATVSQTTTSVPAPEQK